MKIKLLAIILVTALFCGCSKSIENTDICSENEIINSDGEHGSSVEIDYEQYFGEYISDNNEGSTLDVYPNNEGDGVTIKVHQQEDENSIDFEMHAKLENGRLVYSDCVKVKTYVSSDGVIADSTEYEDGVGYLKIDDDKATWSGDMDGSYKDSIFYWMDIVTEISEKDNNEDLSLEDGPLTSEDYDVSHKIWDISGTDKLGDFNEIMKYNFIGTWYGYGPGWNDLIRITEQGAYVYIPTLDMYGDVCYEWELLDRSDRGLCPELCIYYAGKGIAPMAYYVGGVGEDYFYCVAQGITFYKQ